jgi:ADP-ribose pyrophosphatase
MAAGQLHKLGDFFLAPGYSTEFMHVFLATDLYPNPLAPDSDEIIELVRIPGARILELVQAGEFMDAKTLAALFLALPHLK